MEPNQLTTAESPTQATEKRVSPVYTNEQVTEMLKLLKGAGSMELKVEHGLEVAAAGPGRRQIGVDRRWRIRSRSDSPPGHPLPRPAGRR